LQKLFLVAFAVIAAVAADVSHLPSNEYLPPVQEQQIIAGPSNEYLPPVDAESAPAHELADDGYRYKTHRRVVYRRHRRDVNELSNEYLPPFAAPSNEYLAPAETAPETILADDGYRYKTHKRVVTRRHRRDVSHLPSNEYLPPVQAAAQVVYRRRRPSRILYASAPNSVFHTHTQINVQSQDSELNSLTRPDRAAGAATGAGAGANDCTGAEAAGAGGT